MDRATAAPGLQARFATDLPELSIPWRGEENPAQRMLVLNEPLAAGLGLDPQWLRSPDGLRFLTGTGVEPDGGAPAGAQAQPADAQPEDPGQPADLGQVVARGKPVAQAYAGHQFGVYVPRLGDGRALLLGEVSARDGRLADLHLKGSGPTPFSRGGDGRAAVGPMLREYLISEAMHALGIPSTRSLAVVGTGRTVLRQEGPLPGAVLTRVAASHLRVGSFQYARSLEDPSVLRRLADHAIARHYPDMAEAQNPPLELFGRVISAQASLVARWMLVGFVHGVMNTDNMTISGESIDYGPCAFMDAFDRSAVYSSIDSAGRYAYGNQPAIAQWDLARFAEALLPVLHEDPNEAVELATGALESFAGEFQAAYAAGLRRKLGLTGDAPAEGTPGESAATGGDAGPQTPAQDIPADNTWAESGSAQATGELADELFALLQRESIDYTGFFRRLGRAARGDVKPVQAVVTDRPAFDAWLNRWRALDPDPELMARTNPAYIPRNHLVEEALAAALEDNLQPLHGLLDAVTRPYEERDGLERYAEGPPEDFGRYRTFCGT